MNKHWRTRLSIRNSINVEMRQSEVQMVRFARSQRACLTGLACSDILACDEDARFEVQGFLVRSPVRAIDRNTFLAGLSHSILHLRTTYLYRCP